MTDKGKENTMKHINAQLKEVYKDGEVTIDGQTFKVKFDIKAELNEDIETEDLQDGQNIMDVDVNHGRARTTSTNGRVNNYGRIRYAGSFTDNHEIGHMLGFIERYTDYVNPDNKNDVQSFVHVGYEDDVMGSSANMNLNQSHYDAVVRYTNYMLNQSQNSHSKESKLNSTRLQGTVDGYIKSDVNPADIPAGFIRKK